MKLKRKKIKFQELLNTSCGYTNSIKYDVLQWMFKTGWDYRERWQRGHSGYSGVFQLLHNLSSVNSRFFHRNEGFNSYDYLHRDLKLAFMRAIVSDDVEPMVKRWRKDNNIFLGSYRMLTLPEWEPPYFIDGSSHEAGSVYYLFECAKRKLTTQLNECHKESVVIDSILLTPSPDGWMAVLNYGYDGSIWHEDLCDKRGFFDETVRAARLRIEELTERVIDE